MAFVKMQICAFPPLITSSISVNFCHPEIRDCKDFKGDIFRCFWRHSWVILFWKAKNWQTCFWGRVGNVHTVKKAKHFINANTTR